MDQPKVIAEEQRQQKMQGSVSYQKLSQVVGDLRNEHRPYDIRSVTPIETRTYACHERLMTQETR